MKIYYLACQVILLIYVLVFKALKYSNTYLMFETVGKLGVVVKHLEFRKSLALLNFCVIIFKCLLNYVPLNLIFNKELLTDYY